MTDSTSNKRFNKFLKCSPGSTKNVYASFQRVTTSVVILLPRARQTRNAMAHEKKKKHVDKGANTLQIRRARHIAHSVQAGFPAQQYGSQLLEAVGEKRRAYSPLRVQGYLSQSVTTH